MVPALQGLPCFLTIEPRALPWAIAVRHLGAAESNRSSCPDTCPDARSGACSLSLYGCADFQA